jgi:hypothetical protein
MRFYQTDSNTKKEKMNLVRYRQIRGFEVKNRLIKYMELSPYQQSKIVDILDDSGIKFLIHEMPKPVLWYWRLTILFYWLFCLGIIVLYWPIKWLLTGTRSMGEKEIVVKIFYFWSKKLGIR